MTMFCQGKVKRHPQSPETKEIYVFSEHYNLMVNKIQGLGDLIFFIGKETITLKFI